MGQRDFVFRLQQCIAGWTCDLISSQASIVARKTLAVGGTAQLMGLRMPPPAEQAARV